MWKFLCSPNISSNSFECSSITSIFSFIVGLYSENNHGLPNMPLPNNIPFRSCLKGEEPNFVAERGQLIADLEVLFETR
jgi:hypothetical protein